MISSARCSLVSMASRSLSALASLQRCPYSFVLAGKTMKELPLMLRGPTICSTNLATIRSVATSAICRSDEEKGPTIGNTAVPVQLQHQAASEVNLKKAGEKLVKKAVIQGKKSGKLMEPSETERAAAKKAAAEKAAARKEAEKKVAAEKGAAKKAAEKAASKKEAVKKAAAEKAAAKKEALKNAAAEKAAKKEAAKKAAVEKAFAKKEASKNAAADKAAAKKEATKMVAAKKALSAAKKVANEGAASKKEGAIKAAKRKTSPKVSTKKTQEKAVQKIDATEKATAVKVMHVVEKDAEERAAGAARRHHLPDQTSNGLS